MLTSARVPVALPSAVGANLTLKVLDWLGTRVRGTVSPLRLKPAPVTLAWEMVRLAVPVLVKVAVWVPVLPTVIFPKGTLLGLTESWPLAA